MSEWVSEWVREWLSEWVSEWLSEWVSESVSDWVTEWVSGVLFGSTWCDYSIILISKVSRRSERCIWFMQSSHSFFAFSHIFLSGFQLPKLLLLRLILLPLTVSTTFSLIFFPALCCAVLYSTVLYCFCLTLYFCLVFLVLLMIWMSGINNWCLNYWWWYDIVWFKLIKHKMSWLLFMTQNDIG